MEKINLNLFKLYVKENLALLAKKKWGKLSDQQSELLADEFITDDAIKSGYNFNESAFSVAKEIFSYEENAIEDGVNKIIKETRMSLKNIYYNIKVIF